MKKTINILCAFALTSFALLGQANEGVPPEEEAMMDKMAIMEILQAGAMRHMPLSGEELNEQGEVGDFIDLPSGSSLVISFDLSAISEQMPGPLDIMYNPAEMLSLQTKMPNTNDFTEIGNDDYAASVIARTVESQTLCSFTDYPSLGFVVAGKVNANVNGMMQLLDVEMAVFPANVAMPLKASYFIAIPSTDCKWDNPAARQGCQPKNCSVQIGIGWFSGTVSGVCQFGTMLWPLDDVKRCDCAI